MLYDKNMFIVDNIVSDTANTGQHGFNWLLTPKCKASRVTGMGDSEQQQALLIWDNLMGEIVEVVHLG